MASELGLLADPYVGVNPLRIPFGVRPPADTFAMVG